MGRPRSKAPGYLKHKRSGKARVVIDGREFTLGDYDSPESWAKYHELVAEYLTYSRILRDPPAESPLTVAEICDAFYERCTRYYSAESSEPERFVEAYPQLLRLYGHEAARDFGAIKLENVRDVMIEDDLARTLINKRISRIKSTFRWAVSKELLPGDRQQGINDLPPLVQGYTKARESDPVTPAPEDDVEKALACMSPQVAAMVSLQVLSGARPGEIVICRPCDVDRTSDPWLFRPYTHKMKLKGKDRLIFFGPKAQDVLKPFLFRDDDRFYFSPIESLAWYRGKRAEARVTPPTGPGRVSVGSRSRPLRKPREHYDVSSYRRAIKTACKAAGVEPFGPHRLRHLAATLIRKDHELEGASVILGHAHLATTQRYAKENIDKAAEIMLKIG